MENPSPQPDNKESRKKTLATLFTSLAFMVAIGAIVAFDFEKIKSFISHAGVWGLVISVFVYAALGMTFVPSEPLTLLIGAMFGPWMAMIVSWIGNTLAAIVEYYVGQRIGSAANFLEKKEKLPFGLGKLPVDSAWFLIGGRAIPLYGAKAISVVAGVYHVPLFRYLWTTAVTIFFGSLIFSFGGFGLGKLFN
ncbi:MAG: VTT domain-containing protein [Anaerolineaceae bacterium]|nr:VTT domain-containing protein [Anaerolineaceae bacterium]